MIRAQKITKYYGSHRAVADLDFRIEDGECVGFLGLNGAGKTTTLRMLSCLQLPTSGTISVRGLDAEADPHEIRRFIGYLPERPPVYGEMTVREYLRFAGRIRGMAAASLPGRIDEVVGICGLEPVIGAPIDTLSHGFKQRCGIGQAIIHQPALLILDEPMQGLDPVQIVQMRQMIRELRGRHTILLSTHMLAEIEATCDRILVLHEGAIAAHGTEAELAERFGSGGRLELEVRASEAAVREALGALGGVSEITTQAHGGVVRVGLDLDGRTTRRADVSRSIVGAGLDLLELRRITSGLESVFLGLRAGGAAAGRAPEATEAQA